MQFVNEKNITIEYGKVSEMMKALSREVTTVEEYVAWVREWREYHTGVVGGIKSLRTIKNAVKYGALEGGETSINRAQNAKLNLRPFAKRLYELRTERKENFKAGVYGDPTFRVRETEAA